VGAQPAAPAACETLAVTDLGAEHPEGHADEHGVDRWRNSSLELEQGLDIIEHALEALPGDVLAQFVKP
jgi:hypothetical protein